MKQQRRKTQKRHGGNVSIENTRMAFAPSRPGSRNTAPGARKVRGSFYTVVKPRNFSQNLSNGELIPIKTNAPHVELPTVKKTRTVVKIIKGVPTKVEEEIIGGRHTYRRRRHTSRRR